MSTVNVKILKIREDETNEVCECENCNSPVTHKVSGEEDSFGIEWSYFCEPHAKESFEYRNKSDEEGIIDTCEWCKKENVAVFRYRDISEGSSGPVYDVCKCCIQKDQKQIQEEYAEDQMYYDNYDDEPSEEDDVEFSDLEVTPPEVIPQTTGYTKATLSFVDEVKRKREEAAKRKSDLQ